MSRIIVLYQSKYGAARKYAQWLAEALSCDLGETRNASVDQLEPYDTIILGGGIYATGIAGISFLQKNYDRLKNKKIAVFGVGASPYNDKSAAELRQRNLKDALGQIPFFYCRGAWNETAMSFKDRTLCSMLKKMVAKKDPATYEPWEEALMQATGSDCDWTDKKYLEPLIAYAQGNS